MSSAASAVGSWLLAAIVFAVVAIGGGVYRTDCVYDNGVHTVSWGLEGDIPYLWAPDDNRCEAHTLTRYLLGEVGLMRRVN